jgi:predicted amidohydrolase YtcJ
MPTRRLLLVAAVLAALLVTAYLLLRTDRAEVLYVNAVVTTLDPSQPVASAIAVRGDRIVAVGDDRELRARLSAERIVDLGGASVLPGLIDAHGHVESLGASLATLNLVGTSSVEEVQSLIRSSLEGLPRGSWIRGRGWDQNRWPGNGFPHRFELDSVAGSHPVLFVRIDGHAAWVSSSVLELAGIRAETPDPEGGRIVRDAQGGPTGVLIDNALRLLDPVIPRPALQERERFVEAALKQCARYGLTEVHDMGVTLEGVEIYKKLASEGRLPIRVYVALEAPGPAWEHYREHGPEIDLFGGMLTIRALKLYADGALGSRGAALITPYSDDPGNRGLTLTSHQELASISQEALQRGFQVCTHAIGDRANSIVLNVYEEVFKANKGKSLDCRFRVEHAQVLDPSDVPRFAALGVLPSMQPTHCTSDMYWAEDRLGPERVRYAYAWRALIDAGSMIPGGSDFPVESPNPLLGIYAAITRQDTAGWPPGGWQSAQKMTGEEALRSFTCWGAFAAFQETRKGILAPGFLADLTVVSINPSEANVREILASRVLRTIVGGREVYRAPGEEAAR